MESEEKKETAKIETDQTGQPESAANSNPFKDMELNEEEGVRNFDESLLIKRKREKKDLMSSFQLNAIFD